MTGIQALLLPVGADLYALPVDWVLEVVAAPTVTPLATAPAAVLGLFNLRGQIVALLDTAALLGIGTVAASAFAVVVSSAHGPVGLAASGFPQRDRARCLDRSVRVAGHDGALPGGPARGGLLGPGISADA